jgi:hypothetical protein
MSCVEESSSAESSPVPSPSIDSSVKPSPEPRAPKEGVVLCPSDFPIEIDDFGNTSNHSWHKLSYTDTDARISIEADTDTPIRQLWQNRLNYSGSSAQTIAIQATGSHRTSNGTTHWSVGSLPDSTTVTQDRRRFTSHEGESSLTTAHNFYTTG